MVKRHGFRGKGASHGTPDTIRHGGSIGQGTTPGKVWKGKKMPGQMGNKRVSTKGLTVERIDAERKLAVPQGSGAGRGQWLRPDTDHLNSLLLKMLVRRCPMCGIASFFILEATA